MGKAGSVMQKLYTNDDIQNMLDVCGMDIKLKDAVLSHFTGADKAAMSDVFSDGYYERFDRYDSNVCEQFITAYEKEAN